MEHNFLFSLSWLDWTLLTILAISVAWGCFRGLLRTVVSLTALFVSAFLAIRFGEAAAEVWPPMPGRQGFAHAAVFFGVYIVIRVIGALLIHLAHLAGLRGLDLAAGGAFGALRGVALSFLLVLGMSGLGFAKTSSWQQSILPPYLGEGARVIFAQFPPTRDWAEAIPFARRAGFTPLGNYSGKNTFGSSLELFGRRLGVWWRVGGEALPTTVKPLRPAPDLREQAANFVKNMTGGEDNLTERYNSELEEVVLLMGEVSPGGSAKNAQQQMRILDDLREGEIPLSEAMAILRREGVWEPQDAEKLSLAQKLKIMQNMIDLTDKEL